MAKTAPRTLSGFMELLPGQQRQFERILKTLRETYSLYGLSLIHICCSWRPFC